MDRFRPAGAGCQSENQHPRKTLFNTEYLAKRTDCCNNQDRWIESYICYLTREHQRLGGGIIAAHYLRCLSAAYAGFLCSASQNDRFRTWVAIKTTCQWLGQLRRGGPV
jgi:hypothetical protein